MAGRRIDDHSNWIGAHGKHAPLPEVGGKMTQEHSAEGFGALGHYEDTTEAIMHQQMLNKKKVHGHPIKVAQRN
jgi:hypothetical protein